MTGLVAIVLAALAVYVLGILTAIWLRLWWRTRARAGLAPSVKPRPFVVEWPAPVLRVVRKPELPS